MQSRRRRVEPSHENWLGKLALRLMIDRDRCWNELDGVIIALWGFENFGMKDAYPDENCDYNSLRSIAEDELRPRRPPPRKGCEQGWFAHRGSHNSVLLN